MPAEPLSEGESQFEEFGKVDLWNKRGIVILTNLETLICANVVNQRGIVIVGNLDKLICGTSVVVAVSTTTTCGITVVTGKMGGES